MNTKRIRISESKLRGIVKEAVKRVLSEAKKPRDVQHGKYNFKGLRYDKNGNPLYTCDNLPNDKAKGMGWKYSKKHGLYGQISDPTKLYDKVKVEEGINDYFPEEDQGMDDYYYGSIMTFNVDGMFDDLSEEVIEELQSVKDEYCDNSYNYTSVLIRKVNLEPDGFDGYDVSIEAAVCAPEMPLREIENDATEQVWCWIENKSGVRSPRVYIVDEEEVFDRRRENYK